MILGLDQQFSLALSALLKVSLNLCLKFLFYKMGAIFRGVGEGRGWRAGEDVMWFNGFLTLKCSKNTAFSLQTCNGICVNTAFCVARAVQSIVMNMLMQLFS